MTPTERMLVSTAKYWLMVPSRWALAISSRKMKSAWRRGVQLLLGDLTDHPDGKARAREGLAHHQVLRQAQLPAQLTDLVLEQHPQGLDDLLEVHIVRQTAHVVVTLDDGGVAGAGLDHVGIDGALDQIVHLADLLGLRLKDPDELLTDDLPLALRLRDPGQLAQEQVLGVGPDEVDVPTF